MSRRGTIDGLQFARDGQVVSGSIGIDGLPRLAKIGCDAATLQYAVRGAQSPERRPSLTIEIAGRVQLVCQRCLGPLEIPLAVTSELELAGTQAEIDVADDEVDRILATSSMDVAALVEDEAILALPMVPVHERCETRIGQADPAKASRFAALAGLRRDGVGPTGSP